MMNGRKGAYNGNSLTLDDGLIIGMPEDVYFDEFSGCIVSPNGNLIIADQWVVIANQDYIDGIESLTPDPSPRGGENSFKHGSTTVNLAGQKVGTDYKGIIVTAGKKYLRK